jgi:hypothetical protein
MTRVFTQRERMAIRMRMKLYDDCLLICCMRPYRHTTPEPVVTIGQGHNSQLLGSALPETRQ